MNSNALLLPTYHHAPILSEGSMGIPFAAQKPYQATKYSAAFRV